MREGEISNLRIAEPHPARPNSLFVLFGIASKRCTFALYFNAATRCSGVIFSKASGIRGSCDGVGSIDMFDKSA
jgi:hypothetical protein